MYSRLTNNEQSLRKGDSVSAKKISKGSPSANVKAKVISSTGLLNRTAKSSIKSSKHNPLQQHNGPPSNLYGNKDVPVKLKNQKNNQKLHLAAFKAGRHHSKHKNELSKMLTENSSAVMYNSQAKIGHQAPEFGNQSPILTNPKSQLCPSMPNLPPSSKELCNTINKNLSIVRVVNQIVHKQAIDLRSQLERVKNMYALSQMNLNDSNLQIQKLREQISAIQSLFDDYRNKYPLQQCKPTLECKTFNNPEVKNGQTDSNIKEVSKERFNQTSSLILQQKQARIEVINLGTSIKRSYCRKQCQAYCDCLSEMFKVLN